MAFEIINPDAFGARPSGWNHGMLSEKGGRILFVAGQIVPVGDFVTQWDGALGRVIEVVRSAGGKPENIGRMVVFVTDCPSYFSDLTALQEFTRLTCDLILAMRRCRRPIVGALNGTVAGAGAVIAAACDIRVAAESAKIAFLFTKVGLSGADMGAAWLLPRIVGYGHATEMLLTGDFMDAKR